MNRMTLSAVALVVGMGSSIAYAETAAPGAGAQDEQMLTANRPQRTDRRSAGRDQGRVADDARPSEVLACD